MRLIHFNISIGPVIYIAARDLQDKSMATSYSIYTILQWGKAKEKIHTVYFSFQSLQKPVLQHIHPSVFAQNAPKKGLYTTIKSMKNLGDKGKWRPKYSESLCPSKF